MSYCSFVFRVLLAATLLLASVSDAFVLIHPTTSSRRHVTTTSLNLFWFGKGDGDKEKATGEGLGGVAQVMDSMEDFKKTQRVGLLTSTYVQDLASTTVEGSAAEGKVRVFLDGQQRPKRVEINEQYGEVVDVEDLSTALVAAMQDAYVKSREKMSEKMKDLYTELGMPPSSAAP